MLFPARTALALSRLGGRAATLCLAIALAACGGGGGDSPASPAATASPSPAATTSPPPATATATGTLNLTGCTVPIGQSACSATAAWSTQNATAPRVTAGGATLSTLAAGSAAFSATAGTATSVVLADGGTPLASRSTTPACADGGIVRNGACLAFVVSEDVTRNLTAEVLPAAAGIVFQFPNGVPDLGTTGPTSVTFNTTNATPTFSVSAGGATATGNLEFGSCRFGVRMSTFPASVRALSTGQFTMVQNCTLRVFTSGIASNASNVPVKVVLNLGSATSERADMAVSIRDGGAVFPVVNGQQLPFHLGLVFLRPA